MKKTRSVCNVAGVCCEREVPLVEAVLSKLGVEDIAVDRKVSHFVVLPDVLGSADTPNLHSRRLRRFPLLTIPTSSVFIP